MSHGALDVSAIMNLRVPELAGIFSKQSTNSHPRYKNHKFVTEHCYKK
jgi:hypothetical protein